MVDQLNAFASEVTRVAREVGTEGKLGGQAEVKGVGGAWKDLTDHVNSMASNLTAQVRNIAEVTTAVANGDLSRKITVDVRGEILGAEEHDQHDGGPAQRVRGRSHARGARSGYGRKARRPGQVKGVAGAWKDLTDSVNSMASNLTAQVRNIARSDDGRRERRSVAKDHGRRARRNSGAEEHDQHDGGPAQLRSRRKSRAWRAKWVRKENSAARRR